MKKPRQSVSRYRPRGFSLVEILVALAIGLIGILIMTRMTEAWEARKRSGASAGDAQVSGSIGLYRLEQDLRQAGYGFGASQDLGCTVTAYDSGRGTADFSFPMIPVEIVDGAAGASDTLNVLYGTADLMVAAYQFQTSTMTSKTPPINGSREGIRKGDLVIAHDTTLSTCGLFEITDNTNIDGLTINHAEGTYTDYLGVSKTTRFNKAGGLAAVLNNGQMYNLGTTPRRNVWQVANGILTVRNDLFNTGATQIGEGIGNMQAEYGLDTDGNQIIDRWQATLPGAWNQVRAIRVALLARGQQYEKTAVTPNAPLTGWVDDVTGTPVSFVMTNLDGASGALPTEDPQDWRRYRYRVYTTVIPLRNVVWGAMP